MSSDLSQERLQELCVYDDEKGLLVRKFCWTCGAPNAAIFGAHSEGYLTAKLDGKNRLMHRVVWIYFNGAIPKNLVIDHIDGDRANNHIANLRLVTRSGNNMNSRVSKNSRSGVKGVYAHRKGWVVFVHKDKARRIGKYATLGEAIAARKAAEKRYGYIESYHTPDIIKPAPNSHRR